MTLKKDNSYILIFKIGGKTLTYTCRVTDLDEKFITLKDKFNRTISYLREFLISYELIGDDRYESKLKENGLNDF